MTFNEKLLSLRRKSGFSQEELAEKLNVSRQAVSRWEMGETLPDAKNLLELSDIFGVSIDYLLRDEKQADEALAQEKPQTVNNTYINSSSNKSVLSQILHIAHVALPTIFLSVAGYIGKDSLPVMIIFWFVAVFAQFTIIITQKDNFLNISQKDKKTTLQIFTAIHILIAVTAITLFGICNIFNIFIYVLLLHLYTEFVFEASLFNSGKSPYLKEVRLKFYRLNIWFFTPALAALTAQTVMLFAPAQNKYLVFAAALAGLLLICAFVFSLLQRNCVKSYS